MAEYIEREAAIAETRKPRLTDAELRRRLARIPAADVQPVVRGNWRMRRFSEDVYGAECSVCHTTWDAPTNFCPNCGADMRGDDY